MLKKKPSEKIVETKIHKQAAKTLHTKDLEAKALELVKQFESRDKFQKLFVAISEAEEEIKRRIDAGWYYAPYLPLATLPQVDLFNDLTKGDFSYTVAIDPDNPEPWFSSIPAWRPTKPTDVLEEPWFAPAGLNRGTSSGKIYWELNEAEPLHVPVLPAADFDSKQTWVNQRIKEILAMNMFELNDEITREHISATIDQSIKPLVYDYTVICNETNNTPYTVDQGILNVDICLQINNDSPWTYAHGEASYRGIECTQ